MYPVQFILLFEGRNAYSPHHGDAVHILALRHDIDHGCIGVDFTRQYCRSCKSEDSTHDEDTEPEFTIFHLAQPNGAHDALSDRAKRGYSVAIHGLVVWFVGLTEFMAQPATDTSGYLLRLSPGFDTDGIHEAILQ